MILLYCFDVVNPFDTGSPQVSPGTTRKKKARLFNSLSPSRHDRPLLLRLCVELRVYMRLMNACLTSHVLKTLKAAAPCHLAIMAINLKLVTYYNLKTISVGGGTINAVVVIQSHSSLTLLYFHLFVYGIFVFNHRPVHCIPCFCSCSLSKTFFCFLFLF